jgi:tetratricopeptide (TPR) repeat protein
MEAKYQRSTELLEKQLQEDSKNVFAWYNLIRLYRNRKMFDLVAEKGSYVLRNLSFEECENIYPMIGFDTATAFMELGDLDAAEKVCRRVLERSPEFLDILYTLGQVYFKKKNYHHALNYLRQFLIVHEKLQKIPQLHLLSLGTIDYDYLVCSVIGDCFIAIGDKEQALDFYNKALILFSHRGDSISRRMTVQKEVLSTLGNISIRVGNFDKAVEFFEAYLQQDQSNATVLNNLAGSFVKLGEERKAITIYKKALQVDRNYSGAKKNLQVLLRRKKQRTHTAQ